MRADDSLVRRQLHGPCRILTSVLSFDTVTARFRRTVSTAMSLPQIDSVRAAIDSLAQQLTHVSQERIALTHATGRVLAEPIALDRDSPAIDVSAMDGYAIHFEDLDAFSSEAGLQVAAIGTAGHRPLHLSRGQAIRIFTGAPVPVGANVVVQREHTQETASAARLTIPVQAVRLGQNIRRRAENASAGSAVVSSGMIVSESNMAAIASFGLPQIAVYRPVRVGIVNTGDELVPPGESVEPWQIRDSNGPTLQTMVSGKPWLELAFRVTVKDRLERLTGLLQNPPAPVDAWIFTGGVSMGDTDHVPEAITTIGGRVVFHRLPIRPGKPVLGAVGPTGALIIGLPGNPVSVAVTGKRIAVPLLRKLAGAKLLHPPCAWVEVSNPDQKTLDLIWHRLVTLKGEGKACFVDSRGSGDIVSLAASDGFVEIPAGASGAGPWPYYPW